MAERPDPAHDPLADALQLQRAAAAEGFDWNDLDGVWDKLHEEIAELREAGDAAHRQEELGDLLFMLVNLARHLGLDAPSALAAANAKFRRRYGHVRAGLADYAPIGDPERLLQMEARWQEAKQREKAGLLP